MLTDPVGVPDPETETLNVSEPPEGTFAEVVVSVTIDGPGGLPPPPPPPPPDEPPPHPGIATTKKTSEAKTARPALSGFPVTEKNKISDNTNIPRSSGRLPPKGGLVTIVPSATF